MSAQLDLARSLLADIRQRQATETAQSGERRFKILSIEDLENLPREPALFEFDEQADAWRVYWGGYDYEVPSSHVASPIGLLETIRHLGEKGWELTTGTRISEFIVAVSIRCGWDVYGGHVLPPRSNPDDEERAKLKPALRWAVLKRDGFTCRACGATANTGAILHIDHVRPVSRGGYTAFDNLQTLCVACNLGKRDEA